MSTYTKTLWPPPKDKPGIKGYLKTINMDTRGADLVPVSIVTAAGGGLGSCARTAPVWTFDTLTCAAFGEYTHLIHYTAPTGAKADITVAQPILDLCLFQTTAGATSLLLSYGTVDFIDSYATDATPTASTEVKCSYMTMAGPDLYANCDAGAHSTWKIAKCPSGNNPLLAASWSAGIPVGSSAWPIVQLRQIRGGVIVAKADGLYSWDENLSQYKNWLPWLERCPDPLNGVGMAAGRDCVYYPMADGTVIRFDGYSVSDISPKNYHIPHPYNAHLRSRITAMVETGDWLYAATEPCSVGWTHNAGIKVFKCITGTPDVYTDLTTNLVDGLPSTTASIAAIGAGQNDYLYVGADYPFNAVKFLVGTANTAAESIDALEYYTPVIGWYGISKSDSTLQGTSGFSRDGVVQSPIGTGTLMTTEVNSETKYWWRFKIGTTGISAGTTLRGIAIQPDRIVSGDSQRDVTGCNVHFLAGKPDGEEWEWHDFATALTTGGYISSGQIDALAYGSGFIGSSTTPDGPILLAIGQYARDYFFAAPASSTRPAVGSSGKIRFAPQDLADEDYRTAIKKVEKYRITTNYVMADDTVNLQQRFDHKDWGTVGTVLGGPNELVDSSILEGKGLRLETMLSLTDNDDDSVNGPSISAVEVDIEVMEGVGYEQIQEHDETTPLSE